jgi:hypothetical protein
VAKRRSHVREGGPRTFFRMRSSMLARDTHQDEEEEEGRAPRTGPECARLPNGINHAGSRQATRRKGRRGWGTSHKTRMWASPEWDESCWPKTREKWKKKRRVGDLAQHENVRVSARSLRTNATRQSAIRRASSKNDPARLFKIDPTLLFKTHKNNATRHSAILHASLKSQT